MSKPVEKTASTGMEELPGRRPCQCQRCQGLRPVAIKLLCSFFLSGPIIWPGRDAVIVRGVLIVDTGGGGGGGPKLYGSMGVTFTTSP